MIVSMNPGGRWSLFSEEAPPRTDPPSAGLPSPATPPQWKHPREKHSLRPEAFGPVLFRCSKTWNWTLFITTLCILCSEITASEAKRHLFQGNRFQTGVSFVHSRVSKISPGCARCWGKEQPRLDTSHSFFHNTARPPLPPFILDVRVSRTASF